VYADQRPFDEFPAYYVLEVKSMGQSSYDSFIKTSWDTPGLVQKYKWQVSVYMLALGLPCWFVAKNRNTGEIHTEVIDKPFYTQSEVILRVVMMERVVRKGDLPDTCDERVFPCPFFYLHEVEELIFAEDEILDELAEMYEEARLDVKVAEARQKEARKALDAGMGDREKVETDKVKVTYYQRNGTKFDVKKAKETLGEKVVESLMTPTQYKGMRVTIKEDRGEVEASEPGGDSEGSGTDKRRVPDAEEADGTR
jgi:hypothetical protein